jgi:hypothetical protein
MFRALRKTVSFLIRANPVTRAIIRRIALDEEILADLLDTERIRQRIGVNPEIRARFSRLVRLYYPEAGKSGPEPEENAPPPIRLEMPASAPAITDLAPALDWGPRPFPLTSHAVCLLPGSRLLIARWLDRLPADAVVTLIADEAAAGDAGNLAGAYRQIKHQVILPADHESRGETFNTAAAVLPVSPAGRVLTSMPGYPLPDLPARYDLIRFLWRRGCRQFGFLSHAGMQQIEIPLLPEALENRHEGKAAYVFGDACAPARIDPARLENTVTLAGGAVCAQLAEAGLCPSYHLDLDPDHIAGECAEFTRNLPRATVRLLPIECLPLLPVPNRCPVLADPDADPASAAINLKTGVFPAAMDGRMARAELAVCMGCNPVRLAGMPAEAEEHLAAWYESFKRRAAEKGIAVILAAEKGAGN